MKQQTENVNFLLRKASDEQGVVLVTALLFMVILTIMGSASMIIRNTEQQITVNSEVFQHNFYVLEAVTLEGATTIDNTPDTVLSNPGSFPVWLAVENPGIDLTFSSNWPSGIIPKETTLTGSPTDITPNGYASDTTPAGDRIWYAALDTLDNNSEARCNGSSVTYDSSGNARVEKCYAVYGMYDMKSGPGKTYNGKMMLQVGYKKVVYL